MPSIDARNRTAMPLHPAQRLLHQAAFLKSAQTVEQCPPDEGLEVAFAGRSNAGKSSAINRPYRPAQSCSHLQDTGPDPVAELFHPG